MVPKTSVSRTHLALSLLAEDGEARCAVLGKLLGSHIRANGKSQVRRPVQPGSPKMPYGSRMVCVWFWYGTETDHADRRPSSLPCAERVRASFDPPGAGLRTGGFGPVV